MTKHNEQFKLAVVQPYLNGLAGYNTIAKAHGLDHGTVRRWVALHREHGMAGLQKKFSHYSAEFKLSVLQYMQNKGLSYRCVAAAFNIRNPGGIPGWERCYHSGGIDALMPRIRGRPKKMTDSQPLAPNKPADDETRTREELLAEVSHLRMEVAYLKKLPSLSSVAAATASNCAQKAQVVAELRQQFPLAGLLKVAELARSTFYYQQKAALVCDKHLGLKRQISAIFARHKGRYGYRRIALQIRQVGQKVNHKTVQRLMSELGLKSLVRPKKYRSYKGNVGQTAPNVLQREFDAQGTHQKWVTDVTEFNVSGEKLYLSPVMDLYNGEIIAFETAKRPVFELVSSMLEKALAKLKPGDKPILHSDQGWQYRMPAYQRALQSKQVVQSMSRKGNCLDNAAMESFFAILKSEFFYLNKFSSVDELQTRIKKYIHYYNHDRIKAKLKGLSPVQYRTQPLAT
ncbi:IS3 family transposase [Undibacterium sp. TJN25]|uniref:IS3 family transposase n=1 Tax=Undibacterium sp. TJN25 TaxID=3413056 RepID=UPI003BF45598